MTEAGAEFWLFDWANTFENAPEPTSARKTPIEQKTKLRMTRGLKKADCEVDFFFMTIFLFLCLGLVTAVLLVRRGKRISRTSKMSGVNFHHRRTCLKTRIMFLVEASTGDQEFKLQIIRTGLSIRIADGNSKFESRRNAGEGAAGLSNPKQIRIIE